MTDHPDSLASARDALSLVDTSHATLAAAMLEQNAQRLRDVTAIHARLTRLMKEVAEAEALLREALRLSKQSERELVKHGFGGDGDDE